MWACLVAGSAHGLAIALGPDGIDALGLGLDGSGVHIGQVETERPGLPGFDDAAHSNSWVVPASVAVREAPATPNLVTSAHANRVASALISTHPTLPGVAPAASLHSSAFVINSSVGAPDALRAMQHVAQQAGDDVRAVNMSYGKQLGTANLDGTSLLSLGTDYLTRRHETLFVSAGMQNDETNFTPKDAFNNLVVGRTAKDAGVYTEISPDNNALYTVDGRTRPDLVAPGDEITLLDPGDSTGVRSGTSYATPLATGTVALLQQHADARIAAAAAGWDADARRHEVMKAVLMNSTDKVAGILGMDKTVHDSAGQHWLQSPAAFFEHVPIDDELGTGQLNARRALHQFEGGEFDAGAAPVALVGWDYGITLGEDDFATYTLGAVLEAGVYVSATLAWDREVSLDVDLDGDGAYDPGDSFAEDGLTNLDLFLLPKGASDVDERIWSSSSTEFNVEHVFFEIPETGEYELWVGQIDEPLGDQAYALAWWTAATTAPSVPEPGPALLVGAGLAALGARSRGRRG